MTSTAEEATGEFANRKALVQTASDSIEILINEYFDILSIEKILIDDTPCLSG